MNEPNFPDKIGVESPVVKPGTLPSYLLDQEHIWIDPAGYQHRITDLTEESVLWVLDYVLAHAKSLRLRWATEQRKTYDAEEKARRWVLKRKVTAALMRQYLKLSGDPVFEKAWRYEELSK